MHLIIALFLITTFGAVMQTCSSESAATKSDSKITKSADSDTAAANTKTMTPAPDAHNNDEPRINLEEAKKDFDGGKAIFVDTRAEAAFNVEHIKGAINIPAGEFETRYNELSKDKKIIAYCS